MPRKHSSANLIFQLLSSDAIRRVVHDGQTYYSILDIVQQLTDCQAPQQCWDELQERDPELARLAEPMEFPAVSLPDALRIIQSIPTPQAERYKQWIADAAHQHLEEMENPELAIARTRKLYESRGYDRRWVEKRLRGMAARHELTAEWYKRGVTESDEYRQLTNQIMQSAFGMDVEGYRRYKNLSGPYQNLRDHMSDMELVLTMLGETTAALLHRQRNTRGVDKLHADALDAGQIVAHARHEIERRSGQPVVNPGNYLERSLDKTRP